MGDSFSVFFKNISRYALLVAIIMVPLFLLQLGITIANTGIDSYTASIDSMNLLQHLGDSSYAEDSANKLKDYKQPSPVLLVIAFIVAYIGFFLLHTAVVFETDNYYRAEEVGFEDLIKKAASKLLGVIVLAILISLISMVGFILLIVPGIILSVKLSLVLPTYVLEDVSVFTAISRSFQMTKGNAWTIFGTFLIFIILVMIIGGIAAFLILLPILLVSNVIFFIFLQLIGNLFQMLVSCIFVIATYLFYAKISGRLPSKGKLEPEYLSA